MRDETRRDYMMSFHIQLVSFAEAIALGLFAIFSFFTIPQATWFQFAALHEILDVVVESRFQEQILDQFR